MISSEGLRELHTAWLPNITDAGLERLTELLESNSPLLIHGCFTRSVPMGCLATYAAWHHPRTAHLTFDAGISWLHHVAGLNPATSRVIQEWDSQANARWEIRGDLLAAFREELAHRRRKAPTPSRLPALARV